MTTSSGVGLLNSPIASSVLSHRDHWLGGTPQRQLELTLITSPERHIPCCQKSRKQSWFAGNPATVCSSVYKKWTLSFPITGENKSAHLDQWLNRTGTISSMLPWTREPFALKRKPNEPFTPESLQLKRTGLNTKLANNSALTGLRSEILRCSEKVEIMQNNDDSPNGTRLSNEYQWTEIHELRFHNRRPA